MVKRPVSARAATSSAELAKPSGWGVKAPAPFGGKDQLHFPDPRATCNRKPRRHSAIGDVFQQKPKRPRLFDERAIVKAAGPDQIGVFGQSLFQIAQRQIGQRGQHRGISPRGFSRIARLVGDAAHGQHFDHRSQKFGRKNQQAKAILRPLKHKDQRPFPRQVEDFGQRHPRLFQAHEIDRQSHHVTRCARKRHPPGPVDARPPFGRSLSPGQQLLAQNFTGQSLALPCRNTP